MVDGREKIKKKGGKGGRELEPKGGKKRKRTRRGETDSARGWRKRTEGKEKAMRNGEFMVCKKRREEKENSKVASE